VATGYGSKLKMNTILINLLMNVDKYFDNNLIWGGKEKKGFGWCTCHAVGIL
jgi:hypothetical protein